MLLAKCLVFASTVLRVQLFYLHQSQPEFVDLGESAQLQCVATDKVEDRGLSTVWFRRRENKTPLLITSCLDNDPVGKFTCKVDGQKLILEISNVQRDDSGLYFCARGNPNWIFSDGPLLIVGDSYTPHSWVMLLYLPARQASPPLGSNQMACVVHGVSNLVHVSWRDVGEDLPRETLLMKNDSGFLTFVSVLHFPADSGMKMEDITCEVQFNSSGITMKRKAMFRAASSAEAVDDKCLNYSVPVCVVGVVLLLVLISSFLWIRLSPSKQATQGSWHQSSEFSSPEVLQEELCYTQLDFSSRGAMENKRRQALCEGTLKV